MATKHAKLSASGFNKWFNCPGSVALESLFKNEDSSYSKEGTLAHEVAEYCARYRLGMWQGYTHRPKPHGINAEMLEAAEIYADYIERVYEKGKAMGEDVYIFFEYRVDFSHVVPNGFGTSDCIIIYGNTCYVIDFKYGEGIRVKATNNGQTRCYALGVLHDLGFLFDIKDIHTLIIQPRLSTSSTECLSVYELIEWSKLVKPRAIIADSNVREYCPGDHCNKAFCRARNICKARALALLGKVVAYDKNNRRSS